MKTWQRGLVAVCALLALFGGVVYAQTPGMPAVEFPYTGNRTAVWIIAQLHTLFGAFILGAPIFIVIAEWLGYRKQDLRYDRLAKEVTKVTVILFSMTAVTGGLFIFVLLAAYPQFTTWFINQFYLVFAVIYPLLFISGTIVLYMYFYLWDAWKGEKKGRHIALGLLLNLICMITMFVIDGPTSFMNTPPKAEGISPQEFLETATLWDKIANQSWMPLNLHRIDGNVAFGGFVTGLIAAYMYMGARNQEERAYYDWMGFVGNLIAVGATLFQPFTGLLMAYEMCDYDFSFCPYMMADQLSMFFEMQGATVGLMFLAINYYVWLSMKRIEGVEKVRMTILAPIVMVSLPIAIMIVLSYFWIPDPTSLAFLLPLVLSPFVLGRFIPYTVSARTVIKIGFLMAVVSDAIWLTPHGFAATGAKMVAEVELPEAWNFLSGMPGKLSAVFTLVFVTVVNYVLYNRAIKQGTIIWGKIDFASQFVLIFLAFTSIWTMGLMGAVRSLVRKFFHTYNLMPDFTAESFTPTLSYSAWWITGITIIFFTVVSLAVVVSLRPLDWKAPVPDPKMPVPDPKMSVPDSKVPLPEGRPVPARAK
ncbi:MAG TPA: cytochrome ubiquinol oxidase subunit I [Nitrospiraceae bacterium]|jgi:cytochrome bd-type quinol oxidase subunit 1|nr:cytochrome ubiquinol oxidase subunit I [Nitrospiraceae bacterium]